jgi:hypothetical protein
MITDGFKHTLLTPFCQTQLVKADHPSGLTVTSSLSTGRALEKARFFLICSPKEPVDGLRFPQ